MSEKSCRKCEHLLSHHDLVKAVIVTRYVGLKSKLHYALEKPTACYHIEHVACNDPKGEYEHEYDDDETNESDGD